MLRITYKNNGSDESMQTIACKNCSFEGYGLRFACKNNVFCHQGSGLPAKTVGLSDPGCQLLVKTTVLNGPGVQLINNAVCATTGQPELPMGSYSGSRIGS